MGQPALTHYLCYDFVFNDIIQHIFKNGPTSASLCLVLDCWTMIMQQKYVYFRAIWTQVVGIYVEHAYHLTATTNYSAALSDLKLYVTLCRILR